MGMRGNMSAIDAAKEALEARAVTHGDYKRNFEITADLFRVWTGKNLSMIEVSMLLQCLKMAREVCNPETTDSRVDQIGYIELRERMEREHADH